MKELEQLQEIGISLDIDEAWLEAHKNEIMVVTTDDISIGREPLRELLRNEDFLALYFCSELKTFNIVYRK